MAGLLGLGVVSGTQAASRKQGMWGLDLAVLHPTPGGLGIGGDFYVLDNLRVGIGAGSVIWYDTYGISTKYMFMHDKAISPFAGIQVNNTVEHVSQVVGSVLGTESEAENIWHVNVDVGADWQTEAGFNVGLGVSFFAIKGAIDNTVLPYLYVGFFL